MDSEKGERRLHRRPIERRYLLEWENDLKQYIRSHYCGNSDITNIRPCFLLLALCLPVLLRWTKDCFKIANFMRAAENMVITERHESTWVPTIISETVAEHLGTAIAIVDISTRIPLPSDTGFVAEVRTARIRSHLVTKMIRVLAFDAVDVFCKDERLRHESSKHITLCNAFGPLLKSLYQMGTSLCEYEYLEHAAPRLQKMFDQHLDQVEKSILSLPAPSNKDDIFGLD